MHGDPTNMTTTLQTLLILYALIQAIQNLRLATHLGLRLTFLYPALAGLIQNTRMWALNPRWHFAHTHFKMSYVLQVRNGVKMGEGDGTVSLLSLGAMCVEGWQRPRWNPGNIKITTVEVNIPYFTPLCTF
jgi:hypothetical protein